MPTRQEYIDAMNINLGKKEAPKFLTEKQVIELTLLRYDGDPRVAEEIIKELERCNYIICKKGMRPKRLASKNEVMDKKALYKLGKQKKRSLQNMSDVSENYLANKMSRDIAEAKSDKLPSLTKANKFSKLPDMMNFSLSEEAKKLDEQLWKEWDK